MNDSDASTSVQEKTEHSISLIIPIFNEADHLERFLAAVDSLELPAKKELVLVDDCSTDGSLEILQSFSFKSVAKIIRQPFNRGKGAALRTGIENASGDFICVQDADFEYDMQDLLTLLTPLLSGKADIVYGSRFKNGAQVHRTFHYLINRILTICSNLLSGLYISDMETCYKLFKRDIITNIILESNRFGFEPEVTAKIARLQIRVMELPISYFPRNYLEGKKITWKDGLAALRHIVYFNFRKIEFCFKPSMPQEYIPRGKQWL